MKAFLYNYTFNDLMEFKIPEEKIKHFAEVSIESTIRRYYLADLQEDLAKRFYILAEVKNNQYAVGFCIYALKNSDDRRKECLNIYSAELFDDIEIARKAFEKIIN